MARILVIDDEPNITRIVSMLLTDRGHIVDAVNSGEAAVEIASRTPPDLALIDISLPGMNGLETFAALRRQGPLTAIFMTAFGSIRVAIEAMRAGAFDYLTKPFDNDELVITIDRALEVRRLNDEVTQLREDLTSRQAFHGIVGASSSIQQVLRVMAKIARTNAIALISGESGTGKELVARSLHRQSDRAAGPFIAVNCSAIPAGLVEAEFFGHERGAFTDAKQRRVGLFEQADHGTLFLDEVGDLPLESQAKLLRVVEDQSVTRIGGRQPTAVDVRVVAATNKDLRAAVAKGQFRDDLYWRLNIISIELPPLRERLDDLPLLIDYLIDRLNVDLGRRITGLTPRAFARLRGHAWPGNVRELQNALKHAMILADRDVIDVDDLPQHLSPVDGDAGTMALADIVQRATSRAERSAIETTLARCGGNRQATADALGIDRKTLFRKMRTYGIAGADDDPEAERGA
jgi:DNA-binding NtrC family response regulator